MARVLNLKTYKLEIAGAESTRDRGSRASRLSRLGIRERELIELQTPGSIDERKNS